MWRLWRRRSRRLTRAADAAGVGAQCGAFGLDAVDGLAKFSLGGHTPGSTAYLARVDGHTFILSGDITNDKRSIDENLPKAWIYSAFIVPEDTDRTAQLRSWLAALDARADTTVLPAHDVPVMAAHLAKFTGAN